MNLNDKCKTKGHIYTTDLLIRSAKCTDIMLNCMMHSHLYIDIEKNLVYLWLRFSKTLTTCEKPHQFDSFTEGK